MKLRPRRALYIFCSQNYSGAELVFERLMVANRDVVEPIALCPPGEFAGRLRSRGIRVVTTRALLSLGRQHRDIGPVLLLSQLARRFAQAALAIAQTIRSYDIEIVHANNVAAAAYTLLPMLAAKAARRPLAWLWTTQDKKYLVARDAAIAQICARVFDTTIAVSQSVADEFPVQVAKTHVVFSGLDEEFWRFDVAGRKEFRTRYEVPDDTIAIGLIGVVSERKGHHILLPAFDLLRERINRPVRLFIIGPTVPQYEEYQAQLKAQFKDSSITWTGRIGDMKGVYAGLDVIVNATISQYGEPLGTTIYEAMSCERVTLATRTGGSPEIITDGEDGFLCAPDDPDALATRLQYIVEHWDEMATVRIAARHKVLQHFTVSAMARGYNEIYARLLNHEDGA